MQTIMNMSQFKQIRSSMAWRGAAIDQIDRFESTIAVLASRLPLTVELVGSHTSKSIHLPVVRVTTSAGEFTLRDNFYDINLMATLKSPSVLTLDEFFTGIQEPLSWDWYLAEVDRARNYSWREWTDEEMNDPRILRVKDKRPGCDMWWEKGDKERDRWAKRMSNPAWYGCDWSSGEITWDGEFGPGVKLFVQGHAYAEGITVTTSNKKYLKGINSFIIATGTLRSAVMMIERLTVGS